MELLHEEITKQIIRAFYTVYNELGYGFLERVYENSMMIELGKMGLAVEQQYGIKVYYDDIVVGSYSADLLVENKVIVELKAASMLHEVHEAQLINYLKATELEIGLLLNFGESPQFKRKIFQNKSRESSSTNSTSTSTSTSTSNS